MTITTERNALDCEDTRLCGFLFSLLEKTAPKNKLEYLLSFYRHLHYTREIQLPKDIYYKSLCLKALLLSLSASKQTLQKNLCTLTVEVSSSYD